LLVEYNRLINSLINNPNEYNGDETDIQLKKQFSLHILITRQKYPPTVGNTYVFVIQNLTHYTEVIPIGDGTSKLVDMMLDNNIDNFILIDREQEQVIQPVLNNISPNPKVSGPGPNENWLIYSIANWFNGVRDQLNTMFGQVFQPFDFSSDLNTMDWMGIGGAAHKYNDEINGSNNLKQPYIHIGFVTMMPCIYEQLCSIYEKHDVVYNDVFGKTFIRLFILNLTRYNVLSFDENNKIIPGLIPPYNNIDGLGPDGNPEPYSFNLIPKIPITPEDGIHNYDPYEKCVIHTADIDFEIKNIEESELEFKQELIDELNIGKLIKRNKIYNSVFTVDDEFAKALFTKSGITFNEPQEELIETIVGSQLEELIHSIVESSQQELTTPTV
jgi:hypothetical protein